MNFPGSVNSFIGCHKCNNASKGSLVTAISDWVYTMTNSGHPQLIVRLCRDQGVFGQGVELGGGEQNREAMRAGKRTDKAQKGSGFGSSMAS